jgi:hypothetical protein
MRQEVQRLEGCVTRCTGDHLIALSGTPVAQEDHVLRALHVALGIQWAFAAYADDLQRTRAMMLDLGLGVHASTVVTGPLGAGACADVMAPGLPVYLALARHVVFTLLWAPHAPLSPWRRRNYLTSTTGSPTRTIPPAPMDAQTPT